MSKIIVDKLHTRQEIIDIWSRANDDYLNMVTCPNCRCLLYDNPVDGLTSIKRFFCHNKKCNNYNIPIEVIAGGSNEQ